MKILFLSSLYPPRTKGGGELSTHYIAQGLKARGHDVRVITEGDKREELIVEGIPVLRLPVSLTAKPLFEQRMSQRIAKVLQAEIGDPKQYDAIHAHDFRTALALSELTYPNMVVTARDYAQICGTTNAVLIDGSMCHCTLPDILRTQRVQEASLLRKPFRIWQYKYNVEYRKQAFRKFPAQIFISHAEAKVIAEQQDLSQQKTAVIYNPVSASYLSAKLAEGTKGNVLYVGTVEMYKGVGLLLEAWKEIAKQFPYAHLKIVGEGAQKQEYEQHVERSGLQYRVTFTGRIPPERLQRVYDEASVLVAPHIWVEPFGRTVVEAMARGKIVVAANVGGPAEIVNDNKTGLLFKSGSIQSLTRRLKDALMLRDFDRREIQKNAREWVIQNLSSDLIAKQHEEFYGEMRD